jgi:hypothetical protein
MKKIHFLIAIIFGGLCFHSCELDNYDAPSASLSGAFIDSETGELIESDLISGTQVELIEHGFENPSIQRIVVQVDGTYRDDMMFEGTYSIPPIMRGNFVPPIDGDSLTNDTLIIEIKGQTVHDFVVQPYIRIKDANITIDGTKITATFKLQQTVENKIKAIGLFGHISPAVGEPLQVGKKTQTLNKVVDPDDEYELVLDVRTDKDFEKGKAYHFRIGALIDAAEAEYNYAPAVRLMIPLE